ncbi:MAG: hypothetical protein KBD50_03000 [Candidatus Pacebacteria bacterium]|nr:hypothetical protein [Candidatus Paceibacterota bacterium]
MPDLGLKYLMEVIRGRRPQPKPRPELRAVYVSVAATARLQPDRMVDHILNRIKKENALPTK